MYREIERKFLVNGDEWRKDAISHEFCQGYIYSAEHCFVRVRTEDDYAFLTIKGPKSGIERPEFEYPIPITDAKELLDHLAHQPLIYKIRHKISYPPHVWEVDEFCGENSGLIIAEIELKNEEEYFEKPSWLGQEITFDARYRNSALAERPYSQWQNSSSLQSTTNESLINSGKPKQHLDLDLCESTTL